MDHINDCTLFSEMIFSYAKEIVSEEKGEGRKTPEKENREAFLRHLEECDACREELSECVKMLREIEEEPIAVPEDVHSSIMSRVKAEAKVKRQKRYTRIIGGAAAVFVLISPPSLELLETRLRKRATDSEEQLTLRIAAAERELARFRLYDFVIVNDDLATAAGELEGLFRSFRLRTGLIPEGSVPWCRK